MLSYCINLRRCLVILTNSLLRSIVLSALFFNTFSFNGKCQTTFNTTESGQYYIVPSGVTKIKVECIGGGGGGCSGTSSISTGGGGGGGAYARSIIDVIPSNAYPVTVGARGNANSNGNASSFNETVVYAEGGYGATSGTGGLGGNSANCIGAVTYSGGAGGTAASTYSGGGGGAAIAYMSGADASGATAGKTGGLVSNSGAAGRTTSGAGLTGNPSGGGGSGAFGSGYSGGTGANGRITITPLPTITLSTPDIVADDTIYMSTTSQVLYRFSTSTNYNTVLNTLSFITSGTYTSSYVSNFKLWYSTTNGFSSATLLSTLTTSLGTGTHSFSNLWHELNAGTPLYFWITVDVAAVPAVDDVTCAPSATISVEALTTTNLVYDFGNVEGNTSSGGTLLIMPVATITFNNSSISGYTSYQGSTKNIICRIRFYVTQADAVLKSFTFITNSSSYKSADIKNFKLWYSITNDIADALQVGVIYTSLGPGTHTFSDLSITTHPSDARGSYWITMDVADAPTSGDYIKCATLSTSNYKFTFSTGLETVVLGTTYYSNPTVYFRYRNGVTLSTSSPAVNASKVGQGETKQRVYAFSLSTYSSVVEMLNSLSFTVTGNCTSADVTNLKLWYYSTNSLLNASQVGSTITYNGPGTYSFSGLSQSLNSSVNSLTALYFWITIDVSSSATTGDSLFIKALSTSDFTLASTTTKYSYSYDGGVQTIKKVLDSDGDGVWDQYDLDDDNDGIPDLVENAPCSSTTQTELFTNGNFTNGNTGFISSNTYSATSLWEEGYYSVTSNPNSVHYNYASCGDHTSGSGPMLVVNPYPVADKIVWGSGSITVTPNTDYTLSLYLASTVSTNPAELIWSINGESVGHSFAADATTCKWTKNEIVWNSGSNTTATFNLLNVNTQTSGNDFALDDISCKYLSTDCNTDSDGIPDRLDLDSDNDGIFDVQEAGGADTNFDGIADNFVDADGDGLNDVLDNVNSGTASGEITTGIALTNSDTDGDGISDRIDLDSDGDGCFDVMEAGFNDADSDGKIGASPITVNSHGVVLGNGGYTGLLDTNSDGISDYLQKTTYISSQPADQSICLSSGTSTAVFFATIYNVGGTMYWQVSKDAGKTWENVVNNSNYAGAGSNTLTISNLNSSFDGYNYRLLNENASYICSPLKSAIATLRVFESVPSLGTIAGEDTVCTSFTSDYSVVKLSSVVSYNWTIPSDWQLVSGSNTNALMLTSASANGSGQILVSGTNTCGTGATSTLNVKVMTSTPTFLSPTSGVYVCSSTNVTYTTQSGKTNYTWKVYGSLGKDYTLTSGSTATDNTMTLKWYTSGAAKTVGVYYKSGGCYTSEVTNSIGVNLSTIITKQPQSPDPVVAFEGTAVLELVYSANSGINSFEWQISTDGGNTWSTAPTSATYLPVASTYLYIIEKPSYTLNNSMYRCVMNIGTCGTLISNTATLTVIPVASIFNIATSMCSGTTFNITPVDGVNGAIPSGTTYSWSAPSVTGITGATAGSGKSSISGTLTNTTTAPIDMVYTVTPGTGAYNGKTFTVTITVNPSPVIANKTVTICSAQNFSVTANSATDIIPSGTTYSWNAPVNASLSGLNLGSGASSVSGTLTNNSTVAQNVVYTVLPTYGTCQGSSYTVSVTVNPAPSIQSVNSVARCGTGSVTLSATASSGTINWYSSSNSTAVINTGSSYIIPSLSSTTTYYVDATDNGCITANRSSVTATINSLPQLTTAVTENSGIANDGTICSGYGVTLTGFGATTYTWSGGIENGKEFFPIVNETYTLTGADNLGCSNTTSVKITVYATPKTGTIYRKPNQ